MELAGSTIGWVTADFQKSGTWGDATAASRERGGTRLDPLVARLACVLTEIAGFEYG